MPDRHHPYRIEGLCPPPQTQGLYDPQFDHDACGVGMVCHIKGQASHAIVSDGLQILENLAHRGACGCDATTGDGAGILIQMPHVFLLKAAREAGIALPEKGAYGPGWCSCPRRKPAAVVPRAIRGGGARRGAGGAGWRRVPVHPDVIGDLARSTRPAIRQIFIGGGLGWMTSCPLNASFTSFARLWKGGSGMPMGREEAISMFPAFRAGPWSTRACSWPTRCAPFIPIWTIQHGFGPGHRPPALQHQHPAVLGPGPALSLSVPQREINTLRGNINWMNARQALFASELFGEDLAKLFPVATPGGSDSMILDNALELLYHTGRSLPHCIMMLIPEAWQHHASMPADKKDFYAYHACLMEPWDGPASIPFTDGTVVGAVLDRNGLRPSRYTVTRDDRVIMASETGVLDIAPEDVLRKGRLEPGRMFLVDTAEGRIVEDAEIKARIAGRRPYGRWVRDNLHSLSDLPEAAPAQLAQERLSPLQKLFGYTTEEIRMILAPMGRDGQEPTGSMGDDIPLAILSRRPGCFTIISNSFSPRSPIRLWMPFANSW